MKSIGRHQQILRGMSLEIKNDSRKTANEQAEFKKMMARSQMILDSINEVLKETDDFIEAIQQGTVDNCLLDEPTPGTKALEKLKRMLGVTSCDEYLTGND